MADAPDTPVRVLCIAGSPRRSGNSAELLAAAVRGIESAGGQADIISLATEPVRACSGCGQCSPTGACVLADRMRELYPRIDAAEALIVASPVYFAGVPSTLKAFYDRCQPYWARRYVLKAEPRVPRRPGALLLARGGGDPFGSECAVTTTRSVFAVLETTLDECLDIVGPDSPGEILGRPDALRDAEDIGRRIVEEAIRRRSEHP